MVWSCDWDVGTGKDREVCFARAKRGFSSREAAVKAGEKHIKSAGHYHQNWGCEQVESTISVLQKWFK